MSNDPDSILKAAAAGNNAAFEELVRLFDRRVKAICKSVSWPPIDYEDVAQMVWTELLSKLGNFGSSLELCKWFSVTAKRRAIDEKRKHDNRKFSGEADSAESTDSGATTGLEELMKQERTLALKDCLQSEEVTVKTFVLMYIDGLDGREIQQRMGIPPGTVNSRIARGKAAVAKCMEGKLL